MRSFLIPILLGLSVSGISAAVAYLFLRKDEEYEPGISTSRQTVIEVKIPKDCIGAVIGRGGSNIKAIQEKSDTRINFKDECDEEKFRKCIIRGTPEAAQLAESMIHEFVMNQPLIETAEIWVPQRACGRIIGRGGDSIRAISSNSCAKIIIQPAGGEADPYADRRVVIKGTSEQIAVAKSLIEEKVDEDTEIRGSLENRTYRGEPKGYLNYLTASSDDQAEVWHSQRVERLISTGGDGFLEVFVSALESPGKFWVQILSPRGVELDQLEVKMTEYYNKPENQELHALKELVEGKIVAAPFCQEDKWFRAEVCSFVEDEYDSSETRVELYYVDYGDSCRLKQNQIFELSTEFLALPYQAIECFLANVIPVGEEWSDEAINLFEELAQVAQWRKKLAYVVTYGDGSHKRGKRAGSPVPGIDLFDTSTSETISIGDELVKQGFALRESKEPSQGAASSNKEGRSQDQNSVATMSAPSPKTLLTSSPSISSPTASFEHSGNHNTGPSSNFIRGESLQTLPSGFTSKAKYSVVPQANAGWSSKTNRGPVLPETLSEDEIDEDGFTMG